MARWFLYVGGVGAVVAVVAVAAWQVAQTPAAIFQAEVAGPSAAPTPTVTKVTITVEEGEDAQAIASKLERAGVIRSALLFRVLAALEGVEGRLGAGEYQLQKGMTAVEVLDLLRRGFIASELITIPEGLRAEEIGALLEEEGVVPAQEFLQAIAMDYRNEFGFLADLAPGATLEGYLFPDTYDFPKEATAEEVVRQMLANFGRRFGPTLRQEASAADLTIPQVVTIASIVEREAAVADERPTIAGVFLRRLALGMPLAADPTVQYAVANEAESVALYGYWKQDLTLADLAVESPYNTYLHPGLPPGPIANPGLASLTAVVHPATTKYLYFVAKPDGSHVFAETEEEHFRNVQRYRGP